jgi:hypothetical protein
LCLSFEDEYLGFIVSVGEHGFADYKGAPQRQ